MNPVFSADIELAITAACEAGTAIMDIYQTDFLIQEKLDYSPVTSADLASDVIIKKILGITGYPLLSEEGVPSEADLTTGKVWIVDPLDGTKDFIAKTGEFTVLIGLALDGEPVGGVVYCPVTEILYVAEKSQGAYIKNGNNWTRIRVGEEGVLAKAKIVMSRNHLGKIEQEILTGRGLSFIQKGSCGLKIAEVAAGQFDLYFSSGPNQWDVCASHCLINEAGGVFTTLRGEPIKYGDSVRKIPFGVIAANHKIQEQLLDLYRSYENQ